MIFWLSCSAILERSLFLLLWVIVFVRHALISYLFVYKYINVFYIFYNWYNIVVTYHYIHNNTASKLVITSFIKIYLEASPKSHAKTLKTYLIAQKNIPEPPHSSPCSISISIPPSCSTPIKIIATSKHPSTCLWTAPIWEQLVNLSIIVAAWCSGNVWFLKLEISCWISQLYS